MKMIHTPTNKAVKVLRALNEDRSLFEVERKGRRFTVEATDLEKIPSPRPRFHHEWGHRSRT